MKASFARLLVNNSWLLQQKVGDNSTDRIVFEVELNVHVFAKSWWIVISIGFRISERLENRVGLDEHIFNSAMRVLLCFVREMNFIILLPFNVVLWMGVRYSRNIFHDDFRSLRFASAGFSTNHDASVSILLT